MTITSRGAVAPTGDSRRAGAAATAEAAAPVDTAALDAIVHEVADHAGYVGQDRRRGHGPTSSSR